jgi:hypothetical protein
MHDSMAPYCGSKYVYNVGGPHASLCANGEGRWKKAEDIYCTGYQDTPLI